MFFRAPPPPPPSPPPDALASAFLSAIDAWAVVQPILLSTLDQLVCLLTSSTFWLCVLGFAPVAYFVLNSP